MSDFYTRDRRETDDRSIEVEDTYRVGCDECDFDDDLEISGSAVWTNGSWELYSDWVCPKCGNEHECQYVTTIPAEWD